MHAFLLPPKVYSGRKYQQRLTRRFIYSWLLDSPNHLEAEGLVGELLEEKGDAKPVAELIVFSLPFLVIGRYWQNMFSVVSSHDAPLATRSQ